MYSQYESLSGSFLVVFFKVFMHFRTNSDTCFPEGKREVGYASLKVEMITTLRTGIGEESIRLCLAVPA